MKKNNIYFKLFFILFYFNNLLLIDKKYIFYEPTSDANPMRGMYHVPFLESSFKENENWIFQIDLSYREQRMKYENNFNFFYKGYNNLKLNIKDDYINLSSNIGNINFKNFFLYFDISFALREEYDFYLKDINFYNYNFSPSIAGYTLQFGYDFITEESYQSDIYLRLILPSGKINFTNNDFNNLLTEIYNTATGRSEIDIGLNNHFYLYKSVNNYLKLVFDFYIGKVAEINYNSIETIYNFTVVFPPIRSEIVTDLVYSFGKNTFDIGYNLKMQFYKKRNIDDVYINFGPGVDSFLNIIFFGYKYFDNDSYWLPEFNILSSIGIDQKNANFPFFWDFAIGGGFAY